MPCFCGWVEVDYQGDRVVEEVVDVVGEDVEEVHHRLRVGVKEGRFHHQKWRARDTFGTRNTEDAFLLVLGKATSTVHSSEQSK